MSTASGSTPQPLAIAVVGMAGRLGSAPNLEALWRRLCGDDDGHPETLITREAPPGRLEGTHLSHVKAVAVSAVEGRALGDARSGRLAGSELELLDPSVRLAVEVQRAALAQVSSRGASLPQRSGVVLGALAVPTSSASAWRRLCHQRGGHLEGLDRPTLHGRARHVQLPGLTATVAAYDAGFAGPAVAVDAACASSLVAVAEACGLLTAGTVDLMVAGGTARPDLGYTLTGFSHLRALSASGHCRPFDRNADGLVLGEGAGVVVLKRYNDAIRDGDTVYGVIRGAGQSCDREGSMLAPASEGQLRALQAAYAQAGWQPADVDLIACHATGTPLGDRTELATLHRLWSSPDQQGVMHRRPHEHRTRLSAIKGLVGHTLTASGIAGLLEVLLALQHKTYPPTVGCEEPLGLFSEPQMPFCLLAQNEPWKQRQPHTPRRAAVNAFGLGGSNAHLLVEEDSREEDTGSGAVASSAGATAATQPPGQCPLAVVATGVRLGAWRTLAEFSSGIAEAEAAEKTVLGRNPSTVHVFAYEDPPGGMEAAPNDDGFLPIPPRELADMLPQQRVFLRAVHDALGPPARYSGAADTPASHHGGTAPSYKLGALPRVGVVVGAQLDQATTAYHLSWSNHGDPDAPQLNAERTLSGLTGVLANRIARVWNLGGSCVSVSDGVASGHAAIRVAWQRLARGELDAVVAGAVDFDSEPTAQLAHQALHKQGATGVLVDGAIAVVLKRLDDARRDGDRILCTLNDPSVFAARKHARLWTGAAHLANQMAERTTRLDRAQCVTFAQGRIADVLGPTYAAVDHFPSRVRLPTSPLMLVDRVVSMDGSPCYSGRADELRGGEIVTEHDVRPNAWYVENGSMATGVAIEAGQADLLLSAYLGADFVTRGRAYYRLLDAQVTWFDDLPAVGQTVRYGITIHRFFTQAGALFFHFEFDATVEGKPLLQMRNGCAGFFTPEALAQGKGLPQPLVPARPCTPLQAAHLPPAGLPQGKLGLLNRISAFETTPQPRMVGKLDVHPKAWFLVCHFADDPVMPGTLMYEGCLQTFRALLIRLGAAPADATFQPVLEHKAQLLCRGQVLPQHKRIAFDVTVVRIQQQEAQADAVMLVDGKAIVKVTGMALRWQKTAQSAKPVYDHTALVNFAVGAPSRTFGSAYARFDDDTQFVARLPAPPYNFLHAVTSVSTPVGAMGTGTQLCATTQLSGLGWTLEASRQDRLPYAVINEIALQACGCLAAHMGSALTTDTPLKFRNLGGSAALHASYAGSSWAQLEREQLGSLRTAVECTNVTVGSGIILQHYRFKVRLNDGTVAYEGTTYFGFFAEESLATQTAGIAEVPPGLTPTSDASGEDNTRAQLLLSRAPFPQQRWRMLDRITDQREEQTPEGERVVTLQGTYSVPQEAWFFDAHFRDDPVWPGSLGLEAFCQLVQAWVYQTGDKTAQLCHVGAHPHGVEHRWVYRGQVLPGSGEVQVVARLSLLGSTTVLAHGAIWHNQRCIYTMHDFAFVLPTASASSFPRASTAATTGGPIAIP